MFNKTNSKAKILLVVGMHRSGTSALTRVLSLLGAELPQRLSDAAQDNPTGFWEPLDIVYLHDAALASLDSSWDDPCSIPTPWFDSLPAKEYQEKIAEFLTANRADNSLYIIKDPRTSRFIPLWVDSLRNLHTEPYFIICYRHPDEVAASLRKRNGFSRTKSYMLWLRYTLESERNTRGYKRCFCGYGDLMADWRESVKKISQELDIVWPRQTAVTELQVDQFLMPELHHHVAGQEDSVSISNPDWFTKVYLWLKNTAHGNPQPLEVIDQIWQELSAFDSIYAPLYAESKLNTQALLKTEEINLETKQAELAETKTSFAQTQAELVQSQAELAQSQAELAQSQAVLARTHTELTQTQAELAATQAELTILYASRSWRITRPLRTVSIFLRKAKVKYRNQGVKGTIFAISKRILPASLVWSIQEWRFRKRFVAFANAPTILAFPIIPWQFRWQRPQHFLSRLAAQGFQILKMTCHTAVRNAPLCPALEPLTEAVTRAHLHTQTLWGLYTDRLEGDNLDFMMAEMRILLQRLRISDPIYMVQFPTWYPLVERLRGEFGGTIVFDCMDEHSGFANTSQVVVEEEKHIIRCADLVLTSSSTLYDKCRSDNAATLMLRNGTEFEHFHAAVQNGRLDHLANRPIIGYYGAIAEWFDMDLVIMAAKAHPEWNFVLIGDYMAEYGSLASLSPNIHLLGEKPYAELPGYFAYFDVCMIPFKLIPLILATNPVKFYEYLSGAKQVVSVDLPELRPFADLCYLARTRDDFLPLLERALVEKPSPELIERRLRFARENSWDSRIQSLLQHPIFTSRKQKR